MKKFLLLFLLLFLAQPAYAGTFGYTTIGGNTETDAGNDAVALTGEGTVGLNYTSKGGAVIDSIYVYAASASGSTESLAVALYEQPQGEPKHRSWNATLIDTIENIGTSAAWYGINVNWPLDKGWQYCLTVGNGSNTAITLYYDAGNTEDAEFTSATALTNPWTAGTNQSRKYSFYAKVDTFPQAGMIGDSCYANANISILADDGASWQTLQSKTYTASAGDFCSEFKIWVESGDSIAFTLYEYDIVGDTPTICVYSDTMDISGTNTWWAQWLDNWKLTAGKTYTAGIYMVNGASVLFKGSATGGIADSTGALEEDPGTGRECPYSSTGNTGYAEGVNYFFRVLNKKEFGYHPSSAPATSEEIGIAGDTALIVNTGEASTTLKISTSKLNATVESVYVYAEGNNAVDTIYVLLYTVNSVFQPAILTVYDTVPITSTAGWFGIQVNWPLYNNVYCLGVASPDPLNKVFYDPGGTEDAESKLYSPPIPTSYGTEGTNESRKYGLYAVYRVPSWGGSQYQITDSLDDARLNNVPTTNADSNYGASTAGSLRSSTGTTTSNGVIRIKNDPHTSGFTQDSARLYLMTAGGDPANAGESVLVRFYVLKRDWGEGIHLGTTATAGECSWNAAIEGTQDWTTAGAKSAGNDRGSTVACSVYLVGPVIDQTQFSVKIPSSFLTQEFFDNGLVFEIGWSDLSFPTVNYYSDDYATVFRRPYFEGWESQSSTNGLKGILEPNPIIDGAVTSGKIEK